MASIIKRENAKKPPTWQVQIRLPNCKPILRTFASELEARDFAELAESKARKSIARPGSRVSTTFYKEQFKTAIVAYVSSPECSPRQRKLATTILAHIDATPTGEIRKQFVNAYVKKMLKTDSKMGRPFKYNTIGAHIILMGLIYKWRAEELDVDPPSSPFKTTVLPKGWDKGRDRRLAPWEEQALIRTTRAPSRHYRYHWRLIIRLAIETAARQQELAFARWDEFDMEKGLWKMPAEHTKSKEKRIVALTKRAKRILRVLWLLRAEGDPRVFYCFTSCAGISSGFHKMSRQAGLVDFRFHDLRHEAISRMIANNGNVSPFLIMKMVGHKSTEMLSLYCNSTGDEIMGTLG